MESVERLLKRSVDEQLVFLSPEQGRKKNAVCFRRWPCVHVVEALLAAEFLSCTASLCLHASLTWRLAVFMQYTVDQ